MKARPWLNASHDLAISEKHLGLKVKIWGAGGSHDLTRQATECFRGEFLRVHGGEGTHELPFNTPNHREAFENFRKLALPPES